MPDRQFGPLLETLAALPNNCWEKRFTLAELEALLCGPLPGTAHFGWFWDDGIIARRNWARLGFRGRLSFSANRFGVTFTREYVPGA
jgi:hypothetical protein